MTTVQRIAVHASLGLAFAVHAAGAAAAPAPPGMMANVYRLTEAAAVVTVCMESDAFKALPGEKAQRMTALLSRLEGVVQSIARHYRDESLGPTFEATRRKIAGETAMRGYVKTKYQYCGDMLLDDMTAYVESNEKLLGGYFARQTAPAAKNSPPNAPAESTNLSK